MKHPLYSAVPGEVVPAGGGPLADDAELDDRTFKSVCDMIYEKSGIVMTAPKRHLVQRRLRDLMRQSGARSLSEFLDLASRSGSTEEERFINAMTTNLTSFFRESHHFDFLANTIIPELKSKSTSGKKRLRIWSSACSTGEEPYSIAMTLREAIPDVASWDARVLCTDLDSAVVQKASDGIYTEERFDKMDPERMRRWFQRGKGAQANLYRAQDSLRELLVFKQLNLLESWPMRGKFDVIFCRNVFIYFDKSTQKKIVDRYYDVLQDDGYLILGHSESLFKVSQQFELIGKTIYRKLS